VNHETSPALPLDNLIVLYPGVCCAMREKFAPSLESGEIHLAHAVTTIVALLKSQKTSAANEMADSILGWIATSTPEAVLQGVLFTLSFSSAMDAIPVYQPEANASTADDTIAALKGLMSSAATTGMLGYIP
jgi:hypothetical protein